MSDRSRSPEYWEKYHHTHGQLIQLQDELIELNKHITLFEQQTKRSLALINDAEQKDLEIELHIQCFDADGKLIGLAQVIRGWLNSELWSEHDWSSVFRPAEQETCALLHDIEDHWRYPFFGEDAFEPTDLASLSIHLTLVNQYWREIPLNSYQSVIYGAMADAEEWMIETRFDALNKDFIKHLNGFERCSSLFEPTLLKTAYAAERECADDVAYELGRYKLSKLSQLRNELQEYGSGAGSAFEGLLKRELALYGHFYSLGLVDCVSIDVFHHWHKRIVIKR